jgi:hypothetical protein
MDKYPPLSPHAIQGKPNYTYNMAMTTLTDDERIKQFKAYLEAFNDKSYERIKSYLSPDCTGIIEGRQVAGSREEMLPRYLERWKKSSAPIELKEICPIENGVWTLLWNKDTGNAIEAEYFYNEENLHIKHVVKARLPFKSDSKEVPK